MSFKILVINPGATSTKVAVFDNDKPLYQNNVFHDIDDLKECKTLFDQIPYRKQLIRQALNSSGVAVNGLSAVVGRGGLLMPVEGGTYCVGDSMITYLKHAPRGEHASNLGAVLALEFATEAGCPAYIVDPVATDEFEPVARISGSPEIERASMFHALNHKAVAKKVANSLRRTYDDVNFVVAHLGTGVTVGAHYKGRVIDVNDAMNEGAFSADRSGSLPSLKLVDLCFSGKYTQAQLKKQLVGNWGLAGYLNTKDLREIQARINKGDEEASLVLEAFIYQICKDIGAMATVLKGEIDRIILTGGMAHSSVMVEQIRERVEFLAPVEVVPGEEEMESLAMGALRVLLGEETAKEYLWRESGIC